MEEYVFTIRNDILPWRVNYPVLVFGQEMIRMPVLTTSWKESWPKHLDRRSVVKKLPTWYVNTEDGHTHTVLKCVAMRSNFGLCGKSLSHETFQNGIAGEKGASRRKKLFSQNYNIFVA